MSQQADQPISADSPFNLNNNTAYQQWRSARLGYTDPAISDILVQLKDPYRLSDDEKTAIIQCCEKYNMAICCVIIVDLILIICNKTYSRVTCKSAE